MTATRLPLRTAVTLLVLLVAAPARADTKTCIGISEEGQRQRADKKLIAAKDLFDSCSQASCPKIVRDDCVAWSKEVEVQLPTVLFAVRDKSGKDVSAASVLIDGSSSHIADGTAVPLDPGAHVLKVTAGDRAQELTLNVLEGEKHRRVLVTLEDAPVKSTPPTKPTSTPIPPAEKEGVPIGPLIGGGASLVVIGVGVAFQILAVSEDSKSKSLVAAANQEVGNSASCATATPDPASCPNAYQVHQHHDAASTDQTIALTTMGVGAGALVLSGVFLYVLWPKAPHGAQNGLMVAPSIGRGTSALGLYGTF